MASATTSITHTLATNSPHHGAVSCTFDASAEFPFKDLLIYNGTVRLPECKLAIRCKSDTTFQALCQHTLTQHFVAAFAGHQVANAAVPSELQTALRDQTIAYGAVLPFGVVVAFNPTWSWTHKTHLSKNMAYSGNAAVRELALAALGGSEERLWHAFSSVSAWEWSEFSEHWLKDNQAPGFKPRTKRSASKLTPEQVAQLQCSSIADYRGAKVLADMHIGIGQRSGPKNIQEVRPAAEAPGQVELASFTGFHDQAGAVRKQAKQQSAPAAKKRPRKESSGDESATTALGEEPGTLEVVAQGVALRADTKKKRRRAATPDDAPRLQAMSKEEQATYFRQLFCGSEEDMEALCAKNPALAAELGLMPEQQSVIDAGADEPKVGKKAEEMTPDDKARSDFEALANQDIFLPQGEFAPDYSGFLRSFEVPPPLMQVPIYSVVSSNNIGFSPASPPLRAAKPTPAGYIDVMGPTMHQVESLAEDVVFTLLSTNVHRFTVLRQNQPHLFDAEAPKFALRMNRVTAPFNVLIEDCIITRNRFVQNVVANISQIITARGNLEQVFVDCTWDNLETEAFLLAAQECGCSRMAAEKHLAAYGKFQPPAPEDADGFPFLFEFNNNY